MDNIEEIIEKLKKDEIVFKDYINCLCESEKAKELYEYNGDFNKLKEFLEK